MEASKIDKRVRETSLRKFITISGQLFVIILSLCTDTGSACYDCFATFLEGMSVIHIIQKISRDYFKKVVKYIVDDIVLKRKLPKRLLFK